MKRALSATTLAVVFLLVPITLASANTGHPFIPHHVRGTEPAMLQQAGHQTNTSWSGYTTQDVSSYATLFTVVSAKWVQPAVTCSVPDSEIVFFVGLSSPNVEQAGTLAQCVNGIPRYMSWWEMYPTNGATKGFDIQAGDVMKSKVTYLVSKGQFVLMVKDFTSGQSFVQRSQCGLGLDCSPHAAVWIAEAANAGIFPLPDWGTMRFYGCHAQSDSGTIGTISNPAWVDSPIDMVDASHNLRDHVSNLNATGTAFTVTWDAS